MSKTKRLLSMLLVVALVAGIAISGTLAYLTSEDGDVNVMTLGNVEIEQIEQQRVDFIENQHKLEEFEDDKPLFPAVFDGTSINWAPETEWVIANDQAWKVVEDNENVVDKFVTVKNNGKSEAYVRTIIAYEGDKTYGPLGEYIHIVHNTTNVEPQITCEWLEESVTIGEAVYTVAVYTYPAALAPGATTVPSLKQVYINKGATNDVVAKYGDTYEILVLSQAVQTAGFDSAATALDTGFGEANKENVAEWFAGMGAADIWDGTSDTSWYNETDSEFVITTAEQLAGLAELVNGSNNFAGKTIQLSRNINLNNLQWTPIGGSSAFSGTFDGQNHVISNMTIDVNDSAKTQHLGLFGVANNAVIKKLTMENASITAVGSKVYVAAVVGYHVQADGATTILDNVTVNNAKIDAKATTTYVGGVFGFCSKGNMDVTNSTVNSLKITSNATGGTGYVGGLIGYTYKIDPLKVENVTIANLDIDFTGKSSKVGGVTGGDESVSRETGGYKNVSVSGTIDENASVQTSSEVGGFVGISYQYPKTYTGCAADVDVNTKFVGGGFTGSSCVNGWSGGQYDTYVDCTASGDVTAPYAAGFIAHSINHSGYVSMTRVKATGNIHGTTMAGGLIATTTGGAKTITITDAKISGKITGGTVAGVCANTLMASGNTLTLTNVESTVDPLVLPANANVVIKNVE